MALINAAATSRRKVNHINSLLDPSGNLVTKDEDLCEVARDYFVGLECLKSYLSFETISNSYFDSLMIMND